MKIYDKKENEIGTTYKCGLNKITFAQFVNEYSYMY